jgi:hypothetical protein
VSSGKRIDMPHAKERLGGRELKRVVLKALEAGNEADALALLRGIPLRQLVSPLFGALHHMEPRIHWIAVRVMGAVVDRLAGEDMEEARVVLRRMMWNLNDESGGIGWGVPEAMAEILARNKVLAGEFMNILASYSREDANFLEHEPLQHGLLWGLVRVARERPDELREANPDLSFFIKADNPLLRGLSALLAGLLSMEEMRDKLEELVWDQNEIRDDLDGIVPNTRVGALASRALEKLDQRRQGP